MAYGISNSIAKGSKRSKAALLPLVPVGLPWQQQGSSSGSGGSLQQDSRSGTHWLLQQQQQQQQRQLGNSSSAALSQQLGGSAAAAASGSSTSASLTAATANNSSSRGEDAHGGQDLLHVLVAGYSLAFQQMLRSIQTGQPVRGALRAATQVLVLPALLLLEVCESTAASFRRLLVEQVAGAAPLRVPRYVATGQVLRRYDRLESLGRALLYHTPGPFLAEEFLGCAELQLGLYAVVTVGHLLLLGCSVSPAPATAGAGAGSSAATAAAGSGVVPAPQQQQQGAVHVQYKRPELLLVLDVRDVMMVAVEGSSVRLLCMAGDHPGHAVASSMAAATAAAAAWESESAAGGSSDGLDMEDEYGGPAASAAPRRAKAAAAAAPDVAAAGADDAAASEGDAATSAGLRELVLATQQQELSAAGDVAEGSVGVGSTEEQASSGVGSSRNRLSSRLVSSRMVGLAVQAAAPGVADVAAAAAAAGAAAAAAAGAAAAASSSSTVELLGGQGTAGAEEGVPGFGGLGFAGGGKWFVGHTVPCGSEAAARQLQQLLQQACQRLDSLIASSAWQRQLLL
jgi:hypothetical protein